MSSTLGSLRAQLTTFLAGGDYESLWQAVVEVADAVDDDAKISDDERDWFDELYDAVYMAEEDPVDKKSADAGIVGAQNYELKFAICDLIGTTWLTNSNLA